MAKKGVYQFQADLSTDEEFDEFLLQPGLLLLEIYSGWCGPCLGMVIMLKSIQIEVGVENLHLAICKSDTISYLKRFRRTSEPRWLFVLNGRALDIVFGTNVPILLNTIRREVAAIVRNLQRSSQSSRTSDEQKITRKKKRKDSEITSERITYDIAEPQPEEVERQTIKEVAAQALLWQKLLTKEKARRDFFVNMTNAIIENLPYMGVTVFGPQVQLSAVRELTEIADALHMSCKDRKMITATKEDFDAVNYLCKNPLSDEVIDYINGKQILLMYWRVPDDRLGQVQRILHTFAKECTSSHTKPPADAKEKKLTVPALLESIKVKIEIKEDENFSDSEDDDDENKENEPLLNKIEKSKKSIISLGGSKSFKTLEEEEEPRALMARGSQFSRKSNRSMLSIAEEDDNDEEQYIRETSLTDSSMHLTALLSQIGFGELLGEVKPPEVEKKKVRHKTISIPPIWVANTHRTHAALIYKYFRNETKSFLPPDPVPIPPHVIMAFPAYKMKSLMIEAERFKDDVLAYGFFDTDEATNAPKLIANSVENYMTKQRSDNDVLVFKIAKKTSYTMLSFVRSGPTYVSPTVEIGKKEAPMFFPENYLTAEEEARQKAEAAAELAKAEAEAEAEKRALSKKKKLQPDASSGTITIQKGQGRSVSSTLSSQRSTVELSVTEAPQRTSSSAVEEYNTTIVKFSDIVREHEIPAKTEKGLKESTAVLAAEHAPTTESRNNESSLKKHISSLEIEQISTRAEGGADFDMETGIENMPRPDAGDAEIIKMYPTAERYTKYVIPSRVIRSAKIYKLPVIVEEEYEELDINEEFEEMGEMKDIPNDFFVTADTKEDDPADEELAPLTPPNSLVSLTYEQDYSDTLSLETSDDEDPSSANRRAAINAILCRNALKSKTDFASQHYMPSKEIFESLAKTETFTSLKALFSSQVYDIHRSSSDTCAAEKEINQTAAESPEQQQITATSSKTAQRVLHPTTASEATESKEWFEDTLSVDYGTFVDEETLYHNVDNLVEETGMVETAVLIANLATAVAECLTLADNLSSDDNLITKETPTSSVAVIDPMLTANAALYEADNNTPPDDTKYIDLFADDLDPLGDVPAIPIVDKTDVETLVALDSLNQTEEPNFSEYTELFEDLRISIESITAASTKAHSVSTEEKEQMPIVESNAEANMFDLRSNIMPTKDRFPTERTAFQVGVALTEILGLLKTLALSQSQENSASSAEDLFAETTITTTEDLFTIKEPGVLKYSSSTTVFDIPKETERDFEDFTLLDNAESSEDDFVDFTHLDNRESSEDDFEDFTHLDNAESSEDDSEYFTQVDNAKRSAGDFKGSTLLDEVKRSEIDFEDSTLLDKAKRSKSDFEDSTLLDNAKRSKSDFEDYTLLENGSASELVENPKTDMAATATPIPADSMESTASVESATIRESLAFAASFVASFSKLSTTLATEDAKLAINKNHNLRRRHSKRSKDVLAEAKFILRKSQALTEYTISSKVCNQVNQNGLIALTTAQNNDVKSPISAKVSIGTKPSATLKKPALTKGLVAHKDVASGSVKHTAPEETTAAFVSKARTSKKLPKLAKSKSKKKVLKTPKKSSSKNPSKKKSPKKKYAPVEKTNPVNKVQANFLVSRILSPKINTTAFQNLDPWMSIALAEAAASFKGFAEPAKDCAPSKAKKSIRKTCKKKRKPI